MKPGLVDTHCHLDSEGFHQDIEAVLQRALDNGVERILTLGVTASSSQAAVLLAHRFPQVWAAVGIHPNYTQEAAPGDWERIEHLAKDSRVVAIGETGLDKHWDFAPIEIQREYFQRHLELSAATGKPFAVHCREAETEVLDVLQSVSQRHPLSGVMHSFCGTAQTARICLDLGMHLSFAGMLTYRKNQELRDLARTVPLDRLLVETDAPYLAPLPYRGKRNEPAWVRFTAECLAEARAIAIEEVANQTTTNAMRLFWSPPVAR